MTLLLTPLAMAGPSVETTVHAQSAVRAQEPTPHVFGAGGGVALSLRRQFHVELDADFGLSTESAPWFAVGPRARLFATAPYDSVLSILVGGGSVIDGGTRGFVSGGAAFDLLKSDGPRLRLQTEGMLVPRGNSRVLLSVGMVFGRKRPYVPVVLPQADGMVWLPGPVCQWMPPEDASEELQRLQMTLDNVAVMDDRMLPGRKDSPQAARDPGPPPARLMVSASPGDEITIDGASQTLDDGMVTAPLQEGAIEVSVVGGGRAESFPVGLARANVVWIAIEPPPPIRVPFASGSATVSRDHRATIGQIVENAGAWRFRVSGSSSPEGNRDSNRALANRRADAVIAALEAAGMDPSRIERGEPDLDVEDPDPNVQRAAVIQGIE